MTTKTGRPPSMGRRFVLYDLNAKDGELLRHYAEADNRTLSRWIADAVRKELEFRSMIDSKKEK
jgi:hypothetical protein